MNVLIILGAYESFVLRYKPVLIIGFYIYEK